MHDSTCNIVISEARSVARTVQTLVGEEPAEVKKFKRPRQFEAAVHKVKQPKPAHITRFEPSV